MSGQTDPLEERLTHARDVLVSKAREGGSLEGADLLEVRDDVLFLYRHLHNNMERIEVESKERDKELDKRKVNRNPTAVKVFWILLPVIVTSLIGFVVYVWNQGGGTP